MLELLNHYVLILDSTLRKLKLLSRVCAQLDDELKTLKSSGSATMEGSMRPQLKQVLHRIINHRYRPSEELTNYVQDCTAAQRKTMYCNMQEWLPRDLCDMIYGFVFKDSHVHAHQRDLKSGRYPENARFAPQTFLSHTIDTSGFEGSGSISQRRLTKTSRSSPPQNAERFALSCSASFLVSYVTSSTIPSTRNLTSTPMRSMGLVPTGNHFIPVQALTPGNSASNYQHNYAKIASPKLLGAETNEEFMTSWFRETTVCFTGRLESVVVKEKHLDIAIWVSQLQKMNVMYGPDLGHLFTKPPILAKKLSA